jgi:hypothetical protein
MEFKPEFLSKKFKCPHCNIIAQQDWFNGTRLIIAINSIYEHIFLNYRTRIADYKQSAIQNFLEEATDKFPSQINQILPSSISVAICQSCNNFSIWVNKNLVYPRTVPVDSPNEDLADEIKSLYNEAATIFTDSPKGATALLRLALQLLLKQLGKEGKNINSDIGELVSEGLSPKIQKSLDLLRVIGNNAVHPGQINLDDNKEIALKLFKILNVIADEMITRPTEINNIYDDIVPEETKKQISIRDKKEDNKM